MVKKLLDAQAVIWLLDGFDKNAMDYAQANVGDAEAFLSNSNFLSTSDNKHNWQWYEKNEQKAKYEVIVQILKDAGA